MRSPCPGALAILACAALGLACADRPRESWPEGSLLLGRRGALEQLLSRLETLTETPLGQLARETRAALPDCPLVAARAAEGGVLALARELACRDRPGELAALDRVRGDRDLVVALPLESGAHAVVTLSVGSRGDVDAELSLPGGSVSGLGRMLLPGSRPAGPPLLSGHERLTHVRLRPDSGLDVASLIPAGSQGEQLFRLKSELFAGLVLDGTWEAALYLPEPGHRMPRAAMALGFRQREAAVSAMERFVSDLEAVWPVRRTELQLGAARGACLPDLRLLPELSPCYVATERALVLGWNPASLRRALDGAPAELPAGRGAALIDLARFREADARLAEARNGAAPHAVARWPWTRIVADGETREDAVHISVQLQVGTGA